MKKFDNKKNIILFILFTIIIIILIVIFAYFINLAFSYDNKKYDIAVNSFMYDNENNYINAYGQLLCYETIPGGSEGNRQSG